ncbi:MAG: prepilin-type N-terminal cleavage/methylation domain-containing protein [Succinivibrionaceae bacterium]|nr:prepilin-type N-terminal cleavage/methylation domain-containing protein [Succinivibrionaceae bacterium]
MRGVLNINCFRRAKGFNLIELLVSLVVVAVSLFAVAKIQITGMQSVEGSKQSTSSVVSVANLVERLSAHSTAVRTVSRKGGIVELFKGASAVNDAHSSQLADCGGTKDESNLADAKVVIYCEIDAWIYSVYNALNLRNDSDICAFVNIRFTPGYDYKDDFKGIKIPKILAQYKWKKAPSVSTDINCEATDNKLEPPKYNTDPSQDETADIGFSAMEYLLP